MKCPVCKDITMLMTEKHGVEIDYCPECRGIFLDRGELEKIVKLANDTDNYERSERYSDDRRNDYDRKTNSERSGQSYNKPPYKKKKSVLSEIFGAFGGDD